MNVCSGVFDKQIVRRYFFKGSLRIESYRYLLVNVFLDLISRQSLWHQLDGESVHQAVEIKQCFHQMCRGKVIGRGWEHYWPSR